MSSVSPEEHRHASPSRPGRSGDLHGSAVNLAARVCGDAEGNEVLVSAAVRDLASGKGFRFSDRGRALLKGFSEPTRLFRLDRSETR